jgi:hypothetical protein
MSGNKEYRNSLKDGREIYIPHWPVDVSLENLTKAGKILGTENIIRIAELNIPASIVAVMNCENPAVASALVKHFVCQVRIEGKKIDTTTINNMFAGDLHGVIELFTHVIHSQYSDFFSLGLAKVASQEQ